ncbi:hypothetical protein F5J12DRAFT_936094 [Pisolithus orientalis]|uniref:uncharacterized protein n=1 Tax=Pisolithus orientalis TaxID=936130 RepID=UPI00222586B0|nr:uncharacterized protein F5J12DRAFT_936094 [Pisolithus orientalis]KAI6008925.1 hypothetical protein F5J12DRAFT_936094 [Pisolithus orientalis]
MLGIVQRHHDVPVGLGDITDEWNMLDILNKSGTTSIIWNTLLQQGVKDPSAYIKAYSGSNNCPSVCAILTDGSVACQCLRTDPNVMGDDGQVKTGGDAWDQTERDDADGGQDIEPSDVGEREEERFEVEELEILGHQHQEWRQAGKKKKPAVLLSIWEEMQQLDRNKELRGSKVQTKCNLIQDWLKKPLWSKKPHITLRSSYKYSVQAVVCELYQEQIQEKLAKMKVEEGNTHGSKQIQQYQNALMAFIQDDLTEEQLAAAEDIVERWNGQEGPVPETKARNAAKYGYKYVQNFAMEMWRYCRMCIVCMAGWKNEEGTIQACTKLARVPWETFEEPGTPPEHDGKSSPKCAQKKTVANAMRTGKVDSVKLVKNADGEIWIGEITGLSQDQLQKMVHGFVTAHYSCGNPSSAVPFKNFGHHQAEMIAACHLPEGFAFDCNPSHMWMTTATQLLSFWCKQQESHPNDVVRQWKYQKTPAPKCKKNPRRKNVKGKGKAQEEGVADDSMDDSTDDSADDSLDDHSEAEASNVGTDGPSTKKISTNVILVFRYLAGGKTMPRHHSLLVPAQIPHQLMVPIESNGHDSNDEADEDTYLPTLSNSKKTATSLNTNPDLHSGNEYTTELQDHSEYTDEDGLESIPFTDHPTEEGSTSRKKGGKLKSALKCTHQASSALSESSEPDMNQHSPGAKYSSKSNHNGSVTTNAASTNVKQGVPGSTWKSPCVRKAPARPDADVPSPDAKRLCKQTGSNQK